MGKSTKDIQAEITNKIIDSLKAGTIPWRKPWSSSPNCGSPANVVSGKRYRGINPLILELHRHSAVAEFIHCQLYAKHFVGMCDHANLCQKNEGCEKP